MQLLEMDLKKLVENWPDAFSHIIASELRHELCWLYQISKNHLTPYQKQRILELKHTPACLETDFLDYVEKRFQQFDA